MKKIGLLIPKTNLTVEYELQLLFSKGYFDIEKSVFYISKLDYKPTVFIVSQRAAAVMNAQLIVVLDEGAVVGLGTHEELMKTCPAYEEIYSSQFKKEADR